MLNYKGWKVRPHLPYGILLKDFWEFESIVFSIRWYWVSLLTGFLRQRRRCMNEISLKYMLRRYRNMEWWKGWHRIFLWPPIEWISWVGVMVFISYYDRWYYIFYCLLLGLVQEAKGTVEDLCHESKIASFYLWVKKCYSQLLREDTLIFF